MVVGRKRSAVVANAGWKESKVKKFLNLNLQLTSLTDHVESADGGVENQLLWSSTVVHSRSTVSVGQCLQRDILKVVGPLVGDAV